MTLKSSDKALLLGIVGVAIAVLAIIYVAKPNIDTMNSVKAENEQLQARLNELNQKQANRDQYLADTEKYQGKFDEVLNSFPADLNQEISIMFVKGITTDNDFTVSSLGLGEKEQFYTLGMNGGDAALTDGTADAAATEAASTEAASTEATTEAAAGTELTEGAPADTSAYQCYRASFPITYTGSYKSLKDVVSYVDNYSDRMTINSIDIAYDEEADEYSGNMTMMCYAIESADRPERQIELNEVQTGVSNIFQGGSGSGSSDSDSEKLNKYDENDGAAISSNYDFYAMLNPSTSDVSAKVVGQNGPGKEA